MLGRDNPCLVRLCGRYPYSSILVGEALAYVQGASPKATATYHKTGLSTPRSPWNDKGTIMTVEEGPDSGMVLVTLLMAAFMGTVQGVFIGWLIWG